MSSSLKSLSLSEGLEFIGYEAFSSGLLEEVTVPTTVKTIEASAFKKQKLKKLDLSKCTNLVSVGRYAFGNNNLESIILPKNQQITLNGAFNNNSVKEEDAYIYKHTANGIDYSEIVSSAGNLKDITIPSEKKGDRLKKVSAYSFDSVGLVNVTIPASVEEIGSRAFFGNQLVNVIIPDSVIKIDAQSFRLNAPLKKNNII